VGLCGTGPDAVVVNSQIPTAGRFSSSDALSLGGPLPLTAAGTTVLNVGVYFRTGSSPVNASITMSSSARIQYDWTQPFNTYTAVCYWARCKCLSTPCHSPNAPTAL
jgi:hypothetical protein